MREDDRRLRGLIVIILIIAIALSAGLIWWYCISIPPAPSPEPNPDEPDTAFGDEEITVNIDPDAIPDEEDEPQPLVIFDGYWAHEGHEVTGYHIEMPYKVNVSSNINKSTVLLEIKIYVRRSAGEVIELGSSELLQEENITVTEFDDYVNWTSDNFTFPERDEVDLNAIKYNFDIWVRVSGDLNGTAVTIYSSVTDFNFDEFTIYWWWIWPTIIAAMSTGGIASVMGVAILRRKKKDPCACIGEPGCKCDI